jgi:hypothetical protein
MFAMDAGQAFPTKYVSLFADGLAVFSEIIGAPIA